MPKSKGCCCFGSPTVSPPSSPIQSPALFRKVFQTPGDLKGVDVAEANDDALLRAKWVRQKKEEPEYAQVIARADRLSKVSEVSLSLNDVEVEVINEKPFAYDPQKIGATSGAVLLLSGSNFLETKLGQTYFQSLDLTDGQKIVDDIAKDPEALKLAQDAHLLRYNYTDVTIRKALDDGIKQVVFLADGSCPLSIDAAAKFAQNDIKVFGTDLTAMQEKQAFCEKNGISNAHYLAANITTPNEVLQSFADAGLNLREPILFVATSIFTYLPVQVAINWQRKIDELAQEHSDAIAGIGNRLLFDVVRKPPMVMARSQEACVRSNRSITNAFSRAVEHRFDSPDGNTWVAPQDYILLSNSWNTAMLHSQSAEDEIHDYYHPLTQKTERTFNEESRYGVAHIYVADFPPFREPARTEAMNELVQEPQPQPEPLQEPQ